MAAGSNTWSNYRHQADVCHLYQVMHKFGIPDEHIIVFMYDDLAQNSQNPKKGMIINEPNGPDVYKGVPKDYTGADVTSDNFLKVLRGEEMTVGSKKTLKSTKDDHVLVFFDDHGSPNLLCFPRGCDLSGPKLQAAFETASTKGLFKELVFYVEACFAGSVFYKQKFPANVYIVTASPVGASSFAYNYDSTIRAYVADIFSFLFVHNTEVTSLSDTFQQQYDYIMNNIENYSQACQYGDMKLASESLGSFFQQTRYTGLAPTRRVVVTDGVPAWSVAFETARRIYEAEPTAENLAAYKHEILIRDQIDALGDRIVDSIAVRKSFTIAPCITCNSACKCMQYCGSSKTCEYECCNPESCYHDPPRFGFDPAIAEACSEYLTSVFYNECGNDHEYLRSVDSRIIRACRDPNARVMEAAEKIRAECRA
jgi:legumain